MAPKRPEAYATLLRIRRREEDAHAAALGRAHNAVLRAEADRETLRAGHTALLDRTARSRRESADPRQMDSYVRYERHLTRLVAEKDAEIERLREEQGERRTEFEQSHRRRKMIDRLVDRAEARWAEFVEREERRASEEIISMRYGRRVARAGAGR